MLHTHLVKLLRSIWTLAMGGFLGLTGGLVVAVILAFKGARELAATPGVAPYTDPRFAAHGSDAVAGFIGQQLFAVGGVAALVLLGVAVLALNGLGVCKRLWPPTSGSKKADGLRLFAVVGAVVFMLSGAAVTLKINDRWPGLYDTSATETEIADRRAAFDQLHKRSERVVTIAWLCGALALGVSPWCREPAGVAIDNRADAGGTA